MCTLTWFCDANSYHVFFNRDEQLSRVKALPPQIFSQELVDNGVTSEQGQGRFIMPIDPQGGGSWIATNQFGVTLALLNFYQGSMPSGDLVSRGTIVQRLALSRSYGEVLEALGQLDHSRFAPFTLTIFCPETLQNRARVGVARWDGHELQDYTSAGPLISSGVNFEQVSKSRLQAFRKIIVNNRAGDKTENHLSYHRDHSPEKSAFSVCMHRSDAHTVSLSHISVDDKESVFRYADGSPCEFDCDYQVKLKLADQIEKCDSKSVCGKSK